jgi:hypothetical protein
MRSWLNSSVVLRRVPDDIHWGLCQRVFFAVMQHANRSMEPTFIATPKRTELGSTGIRRHDIKELMLRLSYPPNW